MNTRDWKLQDELEELTPEEAESAAGYYEQLSEERGRDE